MEQEYIITVFSENKVGLLSQITTVFTCRNVNIESLTTSESALAGIHKFTIVVRTDPEKIEKLARQVEKRIDVLKVFVFTSDEVVQQEIALYKVTRSRNVEQLVRRHNVRILEIDDDYIVVEKTGYKSETRELFELLQPYGVQQFVRSGTVAIVKSRRELLNEYLEELARNDNIQQTKITKNMAQINFGGVEENVVTREEFPLKKALEVLKDETIAIIGYGVQGPGQSLNLRDNGFNVIVGQREGTRSWERAVADGWVPGQTLFGIEEAAERGTIIQYLLSDAGQIAVWPALRKHLTAGKALYFSHGFGITYKERTGIVPPADVDVILIAPKGSGTSLRRMFLEGRGLNSSFAVFQDATGRAFERVVALGIGVGSGYLFETDFKREVYSDLTGERGTLMGAIQGIFAAQYETLRAHGHTPSEAFNETVEELTQSLMPLVAENGMDWMYANCSTTAQRGALDWWKRFRDAAKPVFEQLYEEVATGREAQRSIDLNSKPDYRQKLEEELRELRESEMWQAGAVVRKLRPENN